MKRSRINALIAEAAEFFADRQFALPPFAHWSPEVWRQKGAECREIVQAQLGWDITDFGRGDYERCGLLLFTVRNGVPGSTAGKSYCEKIMLVKEEQQTPIHYHKEKAEDIINRGGGNLVVRLWNSRDGGLDDSEVVVSLDGVLTRVEGGGTVTLTPGESITLLQGMQHEFWGERGHGMVLVGEVSKVNDDAGDNYFYDPTGRFPEVEEDVAPDRLLVGDYPDYYQF